MSQFARLLCCCLGPFLVPAAEERGELPDFERLAFEGSYVYGRSHAVTCTLKRPRPAEGAEAPHEFTVHWSAHWPHGSEEEKHGPNDEGWYAYVGPLRIAEDGTVTGRSKYHKIAGTFVGEFPRGRFELTYTGGKDMGAPKTLEMEFVARPDRETEAVRGRIAGMEWDDARATVTGRFLDRRGRELDEEDREIALALERGIELRVGRREMPLAWLAPGQEVVLVGAATEEGILPTRMEQPEPPVWTGTLTSVGEGGFAAEAKPERDRDAEPATRRLRFDHAAEVKPLGGRADDRAAALAALAAGQRCEFAAEDRDGVLWVVHFRARR